MALIFGPVIRGRVFFTTVVKKEVQSDHLQQIYHGLRGEMQPVMEDTLLPYSSELTDLEYLLS